MSERPPLRDVARVLPEVLLLLARLRRLHPRSEVRELVAAAVPAPGVAPVDAARAQLALRVSRGLIRRLPRIFPQACLYWSLAAMHFLTRAGQRPVMHIGVAASEGELLSHAWVTVDGQHVAGQPKPARYHEIITLP